MDYANQIIDKIKKNRISTAEVSDCLNKTGAIPDVFPINCGHFTVGKVFWVYAYNDSNWEVHEQISDVPENVIVLVESFDCTKAIFGDLVAKFLILYRRIAGIVVQGKLRDVHRLNKENWPIWYQGPCPLGCFNKKNEEPLDPKLVQSRKKRYHDAIAVCDDSGVVIIPKENHNQDFLDKLDQIEEQEDIWYECIDRKKWNTFDTICLKKYLKK